VDRWVKTAARIAETETGRAYRGMARILVMDDDARIRELMKTALELDGHEVTAVGDGRLGLRAFQESRPDLIIADLVMPEMEGIETIRTLRKQAPDVRILAISGAVSRLVGRSRLDAARMLGADDSLQKPFAIGDLRDAVAALLCVTS
jgi:DNA-binding response OmpR family regulator